MLWPLWRGVVSRADGSPADDAGVDRHQPVRVHHRHCLSAGGDGHERRRESLHAARPGIRGVEYRFWRYCDACGADGVRVSARPDPAACLSARLTDWTSDLEGNSVYVSYDVGWAHV